MVLGRILAYGGAMSDPTPPPPQPTGPAMPPTGTRPGELTDRFLARLIDGVILLIVNFLVVGLIITGAIMGAGGAGFGLGGRSFGATAVSAVVSAVIYVGYFAFMESSRGQTVGKMIMKLHVVGANGGHPDMTEAIKRNIWMGFGILGILPLIGSILGSLASLAAAIVIAVTINSDTVKRQSWFDQFAGGTQVIKQG